MYAMRQRDGISPYQLYNSLNLATNLEQIKKSKESMGRSGSFFFFSTDRKLILKTLKSGELGSMKRILRSYYNHVYIDNPNSLLGKIYGLYEIQIEGFEQIDLIIMENSKQHLYDDQIIRTYDLKGALVNRVFTTSKLILSFI